MDLRTYRYWLKYKHIYSAVILLLLLIVIKPVLSNIIEVGGVMTENAIWSGNDTVIVFSDLTVPNGIILLINGGALIKVGINRGIIVDEGSLVILGTVTDSVYFKPNYAVPGLTWKWNGILIENASGENEININYAHIADAEIGIRIKDSYNVAIRNSSVVNCQNLGLQFVNSGSCFVGNCSVIDNYDGIEVLALGEESSSNNYIQDCLIKNNNNNIYIEVSGFFMNNIIKGNVIESGNNGVWVDNIGGNVNSLNVIEKNIFIGNGSLVGYGLFLACDSIMVRNNIFWKNNIASFNSLQSSNCKIINNSFYQNDWALAIGPGSIGNYYFKNTFSLNYTELLGIKETESNLFTSNNMLHNDDARNIMVNNTTSDMLVSNNYWGTTDTALINTLIFDKHNNPNLGELLYRPFLTEIDTNNPISPPYKVIKQVVNNKVRLTWELNAESDLKGYRVYFGDFMNYSFSDMIELGVDTSIILPEELSIFSNFAITAFDTVGTLENSQFLGHESPFSFASVFPFAGEDTTICKHLTVFDIVSSTVPMQYDALFWKTSGDGIFSNISIQSPEYNPGLLDIQSGGALLSLNVITNSDTLVDSFYLTIIDDPESFAGNDTIVLADTDILLKDASANNYSGVLWLTSGDGTFSSDTIVNTIYSPGSFDNKTGVVYLEMIVYSQCGYTSDSIKVEIESYFSVEGNLWLSQERFSTGVVIAFQQNSEGTKAIQIEKTQDDGFFKFEKLMIGNYYLYALPDTNNLLNYVPGYYANKLRWQSAYLLPVDADIYDVDIHLPSLDYLLPPGEGSISGHMVELSDSFFNSKIYCMPWFDYKNESFCDGGISNITVFLMNDKRTKLLGYTLTDQFGDFSFKNLPFGSYIIDAEKAGFTTIVSPIIKLSPEHKDESDIAIEINKLKIAIKVNNDAGDTDDIIIFPNPAHTYISIPIDDKYMSPIMVELYNIYGVRVLKTEITQEYDNHSYKLDVSKLSSGLFIGRIIGSNNSNCFRFVKR